LDAGYLDASVGELSPFLIKKEREAMTDDKYHVLLVEADTEEVLKGWEFKDVFSYVNIQKPEKGQAWFVWKGRASKTNFREMLLFHM
jgi:hypothetical protein